MNNRKRKCRFRIKVQWGKNKGKWENEEVIEARERTLKV
jgi:hypothetical protein